MNRSLSVLLLLLPLLAAPALCMQGDGVPEPDTYLPPEVGDVAPPLGSVRWYLVEEQGKYPSVEQHRGEVLIVHTWIWFCDSCVRHGVPYAVDLLEANKDRGLRVISLHGENQREDVSDDHFVKVGRELGIDHPMATTSYFGEYSPYFNLNVMGTTTYAFVIGRQGGLVWRGDPSTKGDDFLAAVQAALAAPVAPALAWSKEGMSDDVRPAYAEYVAGDFARAAATAEKLQSKLSRKKDEESLHGARQAAALLELVGRHQEAVAAGLEQAWTARDAAAFVQRLHEAEQGFAKTDLAKRAKELRKEARSDEEFAERVDEWEAWRELELERPALFPARDDRDGKRYAKKLEKYVAKHPDAVGAEAAKALLGRRATE